MLSPDYHSDTTLDEVFVESGPPAQPGLTGLIAGMLLLLAVIALIVIITAGGDGVSAGEAVTTTTVGDGPLR